MEFTIATLDTLGTILIAWAALSVHHKVLEDHDISKSVYKKMRREQKFAILGVLFILIGYFLKFV